MDYTKEILSVLYEAGIGGLSVKKISMHVHHSCNSLFAPVSYDDVRRNVQTWLLRNSKDSSSPVVHCAQRGHYAINLKSPYFRLQHPLFDSDGFNGAVGSAEADTATDEGGMLLLSFD